MMKVIVILFLLAFSSSSLSLDNQDIETRLELMHLEAFRQEGQGSWCACFNKTILIAYLQIMLQVCRAATAAQRTETPASRGRPATLASASRGGPECPATFRRRLELAPFINMRANLYTVVHSYLYATFIVSIRALHQQRRLCLS